MTDLSAVTAAMQTEHQARVDRDTVEPAAPRGRHRGGGENRPRRERDLRRGQHLGDASAATPARGWAQTSPCTPPPKYLGGHSDVLGGALVLRENGDLFQRLNSIQMTGGAVPSPFECWLTMRGIRTMPLRVRQQTATAGALADVLASHKCVEAVHYPGLASHPAHAVAKRQMSGFGGMLSVQAGQNRQESIAIASRLRFFTQATSLGGTESLIEHRASVEEPGTRAPRNLLRVSVGLEHIDDLKGGLRHRASRLMPDAVLLPERRPRFDDSCSRMRLGRGLHGPRT